MDSFTIELVSNASSELFPDNTLSSFTNFCQIKSIWKGNGRLQFRKFPILQCTRLLQMGNFYFMTQFTPKRQEPITWNLGCIHLYPTLLKQ